MRARVLIAAAVLTMAANALAVASPQPVPPAALRAGDPASLIGEGARRLADGMWEITLADGRTLTTHGPDLPLPDGVSGGASRQPRCGTDYFQHVLYGRPAGSPDRLSSVAGTIRTVIREMNGLLNDEAMESGGRSADYKVLCDALGEIRIDGFTAAGNTFTDIVNGAAAAGFTLPNVDYTIFYDGSGGCGMANMTRNDTPGVENPNNEGGDYAVMWSPCWNSVAAMHENGHNQGAVQYNAPNSTGSGGHCYDEKDIMCYSPDGGDRNQSGTVTRCSDRNHFDCNHDDYFDTDTEQDEWLATHWNIGSRYNRFVVIIPTPNQAPLADFGTSCEAYTCTFADFSADPDGSIASHLWTFGDGGTSTAANPVHTYPAGTFTTKLTVTDSGGKKASRSVTITAPAVDPDPATPNLTSGLSRSGTNTSGFVYYKIKVPYGRTTLSVTMDGPLCGLYGCTPLCSVLECAPDLDLYVRPTVKPTTSQYACRSNRFGNSESCTITAPFEAWWYVAVRTASGRPGSEFTIRATY